MRRKGATAARGACQGGACHTWTHVTLTAVKVWDPFPLSQQGHTSYSTLATGSWPALRSSPKTSRRHPPSSSDYQRPVLLRACNVRSGSGSYRARGRAGAGREGSRGTQSPIHLEQGLNTRLIVALDLLSEARLEVRRLRRGRARRLVLSELSRRVGLLQLDGAPALRLRGRLARSRGGLLLAPGRDLRGRLAPPPLRGPGCGPAPGARARPRRPPRGPCAQRPPRPTWPAARAHSRSCSSAKCRSIHATSSACSPICDSSCARWASVSALRRAAMSPSRLASSASRARTSAGAQRRQPSLLGRGEGGGRGGCLAWPPPQRVHEGRTCIGRRLAHALLGGVELLQAQVLLARLRPLADLRVPLRLHGGANLVDLGGVPSSAVRVLSRRRLRARRSLLLSEPRASPRRGAGPQPPRAPGPRGRAVSRSSASSAAAFSAASASAALRLSSSWRGGQERRRSAVTCDWRWRSTSLWRRKRRSSSSATSVRRDASRWSRSWRA